jgi:DnaK suppressor protein
MTFDDDREVARQRLEEESARLQQLRASLSDESPEGSSITDAIEELSSIDQHPADVGSEVFERAKRLSILDDLDGQLADVERAMQRLGDGTYGTCEACGRPIGEARLEAKPAARFCIDDQARAEREVGAA